MCHVGKAGRLERVFEMLEDMSAAGLEPGSTVISGVIHACLLCGDLTTARRAYNLSMQHNIIPVLSQYNRYAVTESYVM